MSRRSSADCIGPPPARGPPGRARAARRGRTAWSGTGRRRRPALLAVVRLAPGGEHDDERAGRPSSVLIARQTSKPFRLGIITSRKTRPAGAARTTSSASSPSAAVNSSTPSSVRSSSACSMSRRMCGSSSTIRTVVIGRTMAETADRRNGGCGRATWTDAIGPTMPHDTRMHDVAEPGDSGRCARSACSRWPTRSTTRRPSSCR